MGIDREDVAVALREQQAELEALLDGRDEDDLRRPSRCDGWSISDVVLHLAQTNEIAVASLKGRFAEATAALARVVGSDGGDVTDPGATVDDWAAAVVAGQRGAPGAEVVDRYRRSAAELHDAVDRCDPHQRVTWVAGQLTARTLATTRLAETWIHTGDVAEGLGVELAPTDRLWFVTRLAWRTLPYAFARAGRELAGPVAFDLVGPAGDRWAFDPDEPAVTTIRGQAVELCEVAARRLDAARTGLRGDGPDADAVLDLVRTFA